MVVHWGFSSGGSPTPTPTPNVRMVPDTADSFWVMAKSGRGTALGHRFIHNTGGSTPGADVGSPWQPFRPVATKEFASVNDDPLSATPIFVYADDTGSQTYAFQRNGSTVYAGSYHGGETLTAESLTVDGTPVDPTVGGSGSTFVYKFSSTITDGTATITVTDLQITIGGTGEIAFSIGSIASAGNFSRPYIGMGITTADVWDEVGFKLVGGGGSEIMAPLGYVSPYGATYLGIASDVRIRSSATGRSVRCVSNVASIAGYRRTSAIRDGSRAKWYFEFASGVLGTKSNITWTTTFEVGAAGATSFAANLLTNGDFASGLTSWNSTSQVATGGSITASSGKARLSRGTAGDNRLYQGGASDVGGIYLLSADLVTSAGPQASLAATSNSNGSTSTPAPALAGVQFTSNGYNAHVFPATQTTTYAMGIQSSGGSGGVQGQTDDFDNMRLIKIAATA